MIAEVEEIREDAPEVELPDGTPVAKEETETPEETEEADSKIAKAGKHSAKAIREAEAEEARQEAKEHRTETEAAEDEAPKAPKRQLPNPLHQHGKKYRKAAELIDKTKVYTLDEALDPAQ